MTTKVTFNDKTSYLAWRRTWKAEYAALSQTIRAAKVERKRLASQQSYAGEQQALCLRLRRDAAHMLYVLKQAKIEAQAQYIERKTAERTAA